jgi:hypothetical protein
MEQLGKSLRSRVWRERIAAIGIIFDRAYGRPTQPIVGEDGQTITLLHLVAMREIGERIISELTGQPTVIDGHANGGGNGAGTAVPPASLGDLSVPATE